MLFPTDVELLPNGNILIVGYKPVTYERAVVETDGIDIYWEYLFTDGYGQIMDAERLENGNTLMVKDDIYSYTNIIREIDDFGATVWETTNFIGPLDVERIPNYPPDAPQIDGPPNGEAGVSYNYEFSALDPDYDGIELITVNWGDNNEQTIFGPFESGEIVTASHSWAIKGSYTITAVAEDVDGLIGPEGTLSVSMPINKPFIYTYPLINWLSNRFHRAFPIIRSVLV
jgi:hypothetical protein